MEKQKQKQQQQQKQKQKQKQRRKQSGADLFVGYAFPGRCPAPAQFAM